MNELEVAFPGLQGTKYRITSPIDEAYNCAAWAAGDTTNWWWPDALEQDYWPEGVPRECSVDAFLQAYATEGFEPSASADPEPPSEKVALFASPSGKPTHVARQLPSGRWTSKLGPAVDIEHDLNALESNLYGNVVQILVRPVNTAGQAESESD